VAIIYGRPDSELEILNEAPSYIEKFEDVDEEHKKLKGNLAKEKKVFFEKVPDKISEEVQKLEKMKNDEKITEENLMKNSVNRIRRILGIEEIIEI